LRALRHGTLQQYRWRARLRTSGTKNSPQWRHLHDPFACIADQFHHLHPALTIHHPSSRKKNHPFEEPPPASTKQENRPKKTWIPTRHKTMTSLSPLTFSIRVRASRHEPDVFYVNKYLKLIEGPLFG